MEKIPRKKCPFVLMHANARTGQKIEGAVMMKIECLKHMDVIFITIMANDSCRSPPIAS